MPSGRIGELALRIRAEEVQADPGGSSTSRSAELGGRGQALVRSVFERVVDELDRTGRVVLIRQLDVRWRVPEEALDQDATAARLAADLVAALRPAWTSPIEAGTPDAQVVVFADPAAWWADALVARARGSARWYHRRVLADDEPWRVLARPESRELALAVLRRLGSDAAGALSAGDPEAVVWLAESLRGKAPRAPTQGAAGRSDGGGTTAPGPTGRSPLEEAVAALVELALAGPGPSWADADPPRPRAEGRAGGSEGDRREKPVRRAAARVEAGEVDEVAHTDHAGLFYLAALVVELGVAERLWAACLPEGRVLGLAARALVPDDPVVSWFAGDDPDAPFAVADPQCDEVLAGGLGELAATLTRRGAEPPALVLRYQGQELTASLDGSVFPVWIGAVGPSELPVALRDVAARWPGRLRAAPPLADLLGPAGRIERRSPADRGPLFRAGGGGTAGRLATAAIGSVAALFEARCGEDPSGSAEGFVRRWLQVRGTRVDLDPETFALRLSARDVDFAVRRAGLDRDPGYLPWLRRTVRLEFRGDEPEDLWPST